MRQSSPAALASPLQTLAEEQDEAASVRTGKRAAAAAGSRLVLTRRVRQRRLCFPVLPASFPASRLLHTSRDRCRPLSTLSDVVQNALTSALLLCFLRAATASLSSLVLVSFLVASGSQEPLSVSVLCEGKSGEESG